MKKFAVSYFAIRLAHEGETETAVDTYHDLTIIKATSAATALDMALERCLEDCPKSEGWQDHAAGVVAINRK